MVGTQNFTAVDMTAFIEKQCGKGIITQRWENKRGLYAHGAQTRGLILLAAAHLQLESTISRVFDDMSISGMNSYTDLVDQS